MDWAKAKRILIISLLITNIVLLGFILFSQCALYDKTNSRDFIKKTKELLKENKIEVTCKVPNKSPRLNTLSVEFESYAPNRLNEKFFNNEAQLDATSLNVVQLNYNGEHINVINSRRLLYENTSIGDKIENFNEKSAMEYCEKFLVDRGFSTSDMVLNKVYKSDGLLHIEYSKLYGKYVIEKAFTNFIIDSHGIKQMDRLWVEVKEESTAKISISSASKALLALLEENELQEQHKKKEVVDISPCYYFDPEAQGYIEDITKALRGRAIPGWRIVFKDGESIVIGDY